MTRIRSSNSRCGDLVRYMLNATSSSNFSEKFCGGNFNDEAYNKDVNTIFLDFENCMPTDAERYLFYVLEQILNEAFDLEADLTLYGSGASSYVKNALQNSSDLKIQKEAFCAVSNYALRIKAYYELAQQLKTVLPNLLWELCSGPLSPSEQIESSQALCKQLTKIIDFVFRFDCLKMCTPSLQNDFSYYRRILSRSADSNSEFWRSTDLIQNNEILTIELANEISLFLASPTPMLKTLLQATINFVKNHPALPVTNTTETLVTIVQICWHMLERKDFYDKISVETRNFVLRVMVGSLILFDHIDDISTPILTNSRGIGAFCKNSPIDMRAIIQLIKINENEQQVKQLMNVLRYTSKHLNDPDTPKAIKTLFD